MRAFIAIDISADVRASVNEVIRKAAQAGRGIKWVSARNIHLTLKFLGDIKDELVPDITAILTTIASTHHPFQLRVCGAGAFPNLRSPNVLWVGLEPSAELSALYSDIEAGMAEMGFEKEQRHFSPHLTIGRVREPGASLPAVSVIATYKDTFFGTIDVAEIRLMKSILKPSGPDYSEEAVIRLNKG